MLTYKELCNMLEAYLNNDCASIVFYYTTSVWDDIMGELLQTQPRVDSEADQGD